MIAFAVIVLVVSAAAEIESSMKDRGLVATDLARPIREMLERARQHPEVDLGEAREAVRAVAVDAAFVQCKLRRLFATISPVLAQLGDDDRGAVLTLLDAVSDSYSEGDYAAANRKLNDLFERVVRALPSVQWPPVETCSEPRQAREAVPACATDWDWQTDRPLDLVAVSRAQRQLQCDLRERGLVDEDLPVEMLDALARARLALEAGDVAAAAAGIEAAHARLGSLQIDRPFLEAKLARIQQRLRARPKGERIIEADQLLEAYRQALDRGDLQEANAVLNELRQVAAPR